jgi:hypothetical protein
MKIQHWCIQRNCNQQVMHHLHALWRLGLNFHGTHLHTHTRWHTHKHWHTHTGDSTYEMQLRALEQELVQHACVSVMTCSSSWTKASGPWQGLVKKIIETIIYNKSNTANTMNIDLTDEYAVRTWNLHFNVLTPLTPLFLCFLESWSWPVDFLFSSSNRSLLPPAVVRSPPACSDHTTQPSIHPHLRLRGSRGCRGRHRCSESSE